jgi:hypothetical protein
MCFIQSKTNNIILSMVVRLMCFKEQKESELLKLTERDIYQVI